MALFKIVGVVCIVLAAIVLADRAPLLEDRFNARNISQSMDMDVAPAPPNPDTQSSDYVQGKQENKEVSDGDLKIVDKPVLLTDYRKQLAREYAEMHYGRSEDTITPQAIVIHWTASDNMQSVYNYFYGEEATTDREYGKLNLTAHFLVDRDGVVYRLTPETYLNRHAIGLNWCSIGVENVGGVNGEQDLTELQLQANIQLVKYLKGKYPTITCLLGHISRTMPERSVYGRKISLIIMRESRTRGRFLCGT